MAIEEKLQSIKNRHEELSVRMSEGGLSGEEFIKLSKEYAELDPVVEAIVSLGDARQEREDLQEMLQDPEMKAIAQEELLAIDKKLPELEQKIRIALIPKDMDDTKDAIVEIRAGTGGDEAALFVGDLFTMIKGYASNEGWRLEVMETSQSEAGGYKEVVAQVTGQNVFAKLKYESGTHRVQRVPKTESSGRIHTSAATIAVLPEAEEAEVDIRNDDLRVDTYRSQGAGGQHVNTTDSAIRITHIPTGVVVEMQEERSQHKNRAKAMKVLATRIYDMQRQKLHDERSEDRKGQVGSGDRSERIRTYNFPQGRVTDHRVNLTLHKLDDVLSGEALNEITEALIADDQATALASVES